MKASLLHSRNTVKATFSGTIKGRRITELELGLTPSIVPYDEFDSVMGTINFHYPLYLFNQVYEDINRQG